VRLPLPPQGYPPSLRLRSIPAGSQWLRIHRCHHASGLYWGRNEPGRWNDPDGSFGVLYAADGLETAFAETFGREVMVEYAPAAVKFLTVRELQERCVARLTACRDLHVVDLSGPALPALNLDAQILTTRDISACQRWSRWWHGAPEKPDGLLYPSRLLPSGINLALFDRCSAHWQEEPLGDLLSWQEASGEPAVVAILDSHGWGLVG
jgi:RES domain-containing protein